MYYETKFRQRFYWLVVETWGYKSNIFCFTQYFSHLFLPHHFPEFLTVSLYVFIVFFVSRPHRFRHPTSVTCYVISLRVFSPAVRHKLPYRARLVFLFFFSPTFTVHSCRSVSPDRIFHQTEFFECTDFVPAEHIECTNKRHKEFPPYHKGLCANNKDISRSNNPGSDSATAWSLSVFCGLGRPCCSKKRDDNFKKSPRPIGQPVET
jgi:hypothetical protein